MEQLKLGTSADWMRQVLLSFQATVCSSGLCHQNSAILKMGISIFENGLLTYLLVSVLHLGLATFLRNRYLIEL
jgi:hypothetical protein